MRIRTVITGIIITFIVLVLLGNCSTRKKMYTKPVMKEHEYQQQEETFKLKETKHYKVKHEVVLTPSNSNRFSRIIVVLPLPADLQHQEIDGDISIGIQPILNTPVDIMTKSPYFKIIKTKPFGSQIIHVELKDPKPEKQWIIYLQYIVRVSNLVFDEHTLQKVRFAEMDTLDKSLLRYLRPETLVEIKRAEIHTAFQNIFPNGINKQEDSVYQVAQKIYEWVLYHSSYQLNVDRGRESRLWGALDLLKTKKGECGDYSALFIALCRVAGIPARAQVGYWAGERNATHVWAEFYIPNIGWIPVDPALGDEGRPTMYFGQIEDLNKRIVVAKSFDHRYTNHNINFLQTFYYMYWYEGSPVDLYGKLVFIAK